MTDHQRKLMIELRGKCMDFILASDKFVSSTNGPWNIEASNALWHTAVNLADARAEFVHSLLKHPLESQI